MNYILEAPTKALRDAPQEQSEMSRTLLLVGISIAGGVSVSA
jgi:hypothetical protein